MNTQIHTQQNNNSYRNFVGKLLLAAIALCLGNLTSQLAHAGRGVEVFCPVSTVTAELSDRLPEGWWFTPTVGRLTGVRIDTIAGDRTLVCLYQAFSGETAVMHKVPRYYRGCKADRRALRFVCYR
jgi:hypothetical protein